MNAERDEQIIDTYYTSVHTSCRKNGKERRQIRYMQKDGRFLVSFQKPHGDWGPYLLDIFTTLIEIRWSMMILLFSLSYIVTWMFFGLCYWLIAYIHGDTESVDNSPCVDNVRGFTGAFLFSMETQATIGYGNRGMTENCIGAIIVVTIHDVFSCFLDTIIIGIVVAKMASARKRAQTVGFSSCAVVNLRNGVLCLSWRLGDFRGNHILEGVITAYLVRHVKQKVGSVRMLYQDIELENHHVVLATPTTIIHKLKPGSPLYKMGPDDLQEENFELVVSFTYTGDSTGMLHQTRTSYTPRDIRWGQRFQDILKVGKKRYKVDYALFNETTWVSVPMICAEAYERETRHLNGDDTLLPSVTESGQIYWTNNNTPEEVVVQTSL
ncbi:PREDICTED: inward rectifier potassium channel 16-like [Cyprinodon variegatus]|uniref:Potassium inwardly rectifying channel subfamily J member 16 n=1 Tax=Cyprinodon variegatus TaxID=28743 RepID=A0A3Q2E2S5_CYPVA|nr:PREDICTED: inward rectifier potassium channel 16-like [Cyprinodon variegatus]